MPNRILHLIYRGHRCAGFLKDTLKLLRAEVAHGDAANALRGVELLKSTPLPSDGVAASRRGVVQHQHVQDIFAQKAELTLRAAQRLLVAGPAARAVGVVDRPSDEELLP